MDTEDKVGPEQHKTIQSGHEGIGLRDAGPWILQEHTEDPRDPLE